MKRLVWQLALTAMVVGLSGCGASGIESADVNGSPQGVKPVCQSIDAAEGDHEDAGTGDVADVDESPQGVKPMCQSIDAANEGTDAEIKNKITYENEYYSVSYDEKRCVLLDDAANVTVIMETAKYNEPAFIKINVWEVMNIHDYAEELNKNDHMTHTTITDNGDEIVVDMEEIYSEETLPGFDGEPYTACMHYRLIQKDGYMVVVETGFDFNPKEANREEIEGDLTLRAVADSIYIK